MKLSPKAYTWIMRIVIAIVLLIVLQVVTFCRNGTLEYYEPTGVTHDGLDPTYYD